MTIAATAKALQMNQAQQIIVVVLPPSGVGRGGAGEPRTAQIYRLPHSRAEGLSEASHAFQAAFATRGLASSPLPVEILARLLRVLEKPEEADEPILRPAPDAPSAQFSTLTPRERDVLQLVLEGLHNKNIANALRISMRTVENHRAAIMRKTGSKSLPALVRLAIAAGEGAGAVSTRRPTDAAPRVRQGPRDRQAVIAL